MTDAADTNDVQAMMMQFFKPPSFDFAADTDPPQALDYSNMAHWAAHPSKAGSLGDLSPPGASQMPNDARPADCFFVHPTGMFDAEHWNETHDTEKGPLNKKTAEQTDNMLAGQASAFNARCRVYAPYYRQMSLVGYFAPNQGVQGLANGRAAMECAYEDVVAAFRYFLKHFNKGRPFILASHSQGGHHMHRLLEDAVDGDPCFQNFIACYMIGSKIPVERVEKAYRHITLSSGPADLKVVIGWDTVDSKSPAEELTSQGGSGNLGVRWKEGWLDSKGPIIGVNPYTWKPSLGETIDGSHNKGLLQIEVTTPSGSKNYLEAVCII